MKLLEWTMEGVLGAPDGTVSLARGPKGAPLDLALITGDVASGKSSMLNALAALKEAIGPYGAPPDPAKLRRHGAATSRIAAKWLLSSDEVMLSGAKSPIATTELPLGDGPLPLAEAGLSRVFSTYSTDRAQPKMELFPASRTLDTSRGPRAPSDLTEARLRLSSDPDKYAGIRKTFTDLVTKDGVASAARLSARGVVARWEQPDSLAGIKRSIADLAPWLRLVSVVPEGSDWAVMFERRDGRSIELSQLSEAEKQAVLFAVVFDRVGLDGSIVLIDTPELHLHPDHHVPFLRALAGLGKNNQLIVATTSLSILAEVAPQQVIHIDGRGGVS